jgi:hypothetical protein
MTVITVKGFRGADDKVYTGYWNGKDYNGKIYINGLTVNNNYVLVNGEKSQKKSITIDSSEILKIETCVNQVKKELPKTVENWMRLMEKSEGVR